MTMPVNSGETDAGKTGTAPKEDPKVDGGAPKGGIDEASREDLLEEIKKLRAESAARRVDARKAKSELQQFEEWKRSQMTEAERLKADLEEARNSAMTAYVDVFAEKYNVPEERRQFISGNTKEEVENACKALGEKKIETPAGQTASPNLFPGTSGAAVGSKSGGKVDFDEILRAKLQGR